MNSVTDWSKLLEAELPGRVAQRRWSPRLAYGRHFSRPRDPRTREAAVGMLVYPWHDDWHLALIRRPATMAHHAGQIALPGGMVEPGETSDEAMRREVYEELGVETRAGDCAGKLSPLYVFNSRFWVQPWLVVLPGRPNYTPAPGEVDTLIEYPLSELQRALPSDCCRIDRWGTRWHAPCFRWHDHEIWGATSLMLAELQAVVERGVPAISSV